MRIGLLLAVLSTLLSAEAITLDAIEVDETVLPVGSYNVSQDEAANTYSITVQERLNRDVSFSVTPDIIGESAISFRGLDSKATEFVEDGIPLYRSVNGVMDTKLTSMNSELYMNDGSGASSFGVSPMGGEVTLVSKRPRDTFESRLNTTVSTNDKYLYGYVGSLMGDLYIQADADVYHRSSFTLSDGYEETPVQAKGERVNSDRQQQSVALKSGVFIGEQTHLAAKVRLVTAEYSLPPNTFTDLVLPVWDAYTRIDHKQMGSLYLYADYNADSLVLSFRGYYDDYEDTFKVYDDLSYQSAWPEVLYDDARLGTVIKAELNKESYKTSIVFQAESNEHIRHGGGFDTANYRADKIKGSLLHAWYLSSAWRLDGALSYTFMQANEAAEASAVTPTNDKKALDALAKVTYENEQCTLYGSIAKKSRMPTMEEMFTFFPWTVATPELKPERSVQTAMGYQQMVGEESLVELSIYYYDIKDLIVDSGTGYSNREAAEHYGAEVRTESSYFSRQLIRFSYAYAHAVDSEGEWLELVPQHQVKVEDTVMISSEWEAYASYRYLGSRYSSNSATYSDEKLKLSAYHLVDMQVNYKPTKHVTGRVGIKNLLDEAYEWRYGYPAEGRSFYVSLELVL
jgi:outer membrane cobalamin receptor